MVSTRTQLAAQMGHVSTAARDRGKQPQGIRKPRIPHRTTPPQRQRASDCIASDQPKPSPPAKSLPRKATATPNKRGTKRPIDAQDDLDDVYKRPRRSAVSSVKSPSKLVTKCTDISKPTNPVTFWVKKGMWPRQYFEPEMERLLARKKSLPSLNRKRSNSSLSSTPSDQKPREEKSAPYRDTRYELLLQTKNTYMDISELGITDSSKTLIRNLLEDDQSVPKDTTFDDSVFVDACRNLRGRNEARIIQDVSRLLVPSAETLALRAKTLSHLVESVNEGWNNSVPLTGTRPQPDYSLGFKREAFSEEQLTKLSPFIGDFIAGDQSFFMATYYMYFPFLTCEVKCGAAALDVADRQNAHSMTLAVRAVTELFRAVKREDEVHRQILAFSISHDHRSVRIYGHYPVIDGKNTKYYRHPIRTFDFTELDGKEKWTAYRFTKNVYDVWMLSHFKRICSAIDQLPEDLDFEDHSLASTGLSQGLQSHHLMQSDADSVSLDAEQDGQSSRAEQEAVTPSTSFTGQGIAKKRKGRKK